MHILAAFSPLDPNTGARPTVRVSSAQLRAINGLGSQRWWPAILRKPTLTMKLFEGDFSTSIEPGTAAIALALDQMARIDANVRRYVWQGATVTIYAGNEDTAWPWPVVFTGRVKDYAARANRLELNAEVDMAPFEAKLPTATYAGTSGLEGGSDIKGQVKPWVLGRARFVEPVLLDAVNSVFQVSAYAAIKDVLAVYERGAQFSASLGDHGSLAALLAAAVPEGRWATCKAQGLIRLGAPPVGVITADVDGDYSGSVFPRLPGAMIKRAAALAGVSSTLLDTASLDAMDAAVASLPAGGFCNRVMRQQISLIDFSRELARQCNYQAGVDFTGKLFVTQPSLASPALTIDAQGRRKPGVIAASESGVSPPYKQINMSGARCWRPLSLDEIAFYSRPNPRGLYSDTETYREGDIVNLPDGSSWIFVGDTPLAGSAPAVGNPSWAFMAEVSDLPWDNVTGPNKPEDGATVGATPEEQEQIAQIPLISAYVADMQPRVAAAEQAIEDLQNSVTPPDIDELRDRILAAEGEIDTVETALGAQDARITTAQTTADTAVGDLAEVSTRLTTAEGSISSTLTVIQTLEDTVAQANLELGAQDARITQNALAISTVEGQQASLELDLDALGASVNTLAMATSTLDGNVATLKTRASAAGNNLLPNGSFEDGFKGWQSNLGGWEARTANGWGPYAFHDVTTADFQENQLVSDFIQIAAGQPYTVTADAALHVATGSASMHVTISWHDSLGNEITYNEGPLLFGSFDFSVDDSRRDALKLTATAPVGATQCRVWLLMRKETGTIHPFGYAWRQAKLERGSVATGYSQEASVSSAFSALSTLTTQFAAVDLTAQTADANAGLALQAITQIENDVTLLYGRAALTVGVGGIISGVEINGTPVGSTIDFSATATRFRDPSGAGPRTEYMDGVWRTHAGSTMLIWGSPFGTSGQFVRWFGPALSSISQCSEGNATEYLKTNGDAYFGGALSAGTLRNSVTSTSPASNASVLMENIGSNGHTRSLVLSYSWSLSRTASGTPPTPVNPTATINLYRGTDAGGVLIATLNVGPGDYQTEPAGGGQTQIDSSMSGSLTVNDTSGGVTVSYYAVISARNVVAGGVPVQRITIVSTEV